jgi:hypothetical protein
LKCHCLDDREIRSATNRQGRSLDSDDHYSGTFSRTARSAETGAPHSLEHFVIYCLTGAAFARGYNLRGDLLAVLLVVFAGAIEVAQLFVPGRHARLSDFIVDALAGLVGLALASLAKQHCGHEASPAFIARRNCFVFLGQSFLDRDYGKVRHSE